MSHAEKLIGLPLLVRIRYVRCGLHRPPVIRETLKSLGLTRLQQEVVHKNIRPIRGKIHVVCQIPSSPQKTHPDLRSNTLLN